jgi:hypothetical protein
MRGFVRMGIVVGLLAPAAAAGQPVRRRPDPGPVRAAPAIRTATEVRVDGVADEAVWRGTDPIGGFRQYDPEPDADPTLRTDFRVAYDEHDLYVFVRAYDPHPDSIMRALSRRDVRGPSDQIGIYIDSYHDRRTGFAFYVNPDGVKRDFAVSDDSNEDSSWNGVWDVATRVDSLGWTAEFRIPLSQLRYADAEEHTFGFGVRRTVERYPESVAWPAYSRTTPGLMSQLGTLDGLEGLGSADRVELSPYVVAKNVTRPAAGGTWEHPQETAVGADLKIGLTPNVTLNATVNPDFGQVEADPAVLNLSAFETFFSERRPFFVEGTGLYTFSLNCYIVVDCSTNEGLFYSRRIGRSPSLAGEYGDASTPTATPIRVAAKLTGRSAGGLSFGVLDAVTGGVTGTEDRTVEPRANYAVLRAHQDLRDGDAGLGVIVTAVNRATDAWSAPWLHGSAYVAGASFRNRFGGKNYQVSGSVAVSRVAGTHEAISRTQRSSVHYYQQPGDDPRVDSTATSLGGYAAQLKIGKYGGGITRIESSLVRMSSGFEVNDLGYLRRADVTDWSTWAALSFQTPTKLYRWAQVNGNTWHHWNTSGARIESAVNLNGHMGLHNNWDVHLGATVNRLAGALCDRCTRGGPLLRRDPGIYPWGGVNADSRRAVAPGIWFNAGFWDGGRSSSVGLDPYVQLRFSTRMSARIGASVYDASDDTQWFGNYTKDGATHYAFAHLDQRTVSLNLRVNYTLTPDLTFELYGEPFTSSGTYTSLREVSATPDAVRYDDRFVPYPTPADAATSFSFSQLRTNAVVRWEYRPGSTLFVVWAHGREGSGEDGRRQSWQADFRDLLDRHPDNTFLVKVAYWFNR